jgi:hypothetical protein
MVCCAADGTGEKLPTAEAIRSDDDNDPMSFISLSPSIDFFAGSPERACGFP